MNTRLVNVAARVIRCAQVRGTITATGLAIALDSAQLLQSPETVAQVRADGLAEGADAVDAMQSARDDVVAAALGALPDRVEIEHKTSRKAARLLRKMAATGQAPAAQNGRCGYPDSSGVSCTKDTGHASCAWPEDPHDGDPDSGKPDPAELRRETALAMCAWVRATGELLGETRAATDRLIGDLAQAVRDVREHEHPKWEDLYCQNLLWWLGERMAPVLRRLLDCEAKSERLRARLGEAVATVARMEQARVEREEVENALRAQVAELEARLAEYERPADEDPIAYALTEQAADTYPPALPWARLMDDEDLHDFLDELAAAAITHASNATALAEVEATCGRWRMIAEAQHAHNTAPGPDAETRTPDAITRLIAPIQVLRADEAAEAGDDR